MRTSSASKISFKRKSRKFSILSWEVFSVKGSRYLYGRSSLVMPGTSSSGLASMTAPLARVTSPGPHVVKVPNGDITMQLNALPVASMPSRRTFLTLGSSLCFGFSVSRTARHQACANPASPWPLFCSFWLRNSMSGSMFASRSCCATSRARTIKFAARSR